MGKPTPRHCVQDAALRLRECILQALDVYEERLRNELRAGILEALDTYEERVRTQVLGEFSAPLKTAEFNIAPGMKCELCGQQCTSGTPDMQAVQAVVESSGVGVMCGLCGQRCAMPGIAAFQAVDLRPVSGFGNSPKAIVNGSTSGGLSSDTAVVPSNLCTEDAVLAVPRCFEAQATGKPVVHLLPKGSVGSITQEAQKARPSFRAAAAVADAVKSVMPTHVISAEKSADQQDFSDVFKTEPPSPSSKAQLSNQIPMDDSMPGMTDPSAQARTSRSTVRQSRRENGEVKIEPDAGNSSVVAQAIKNRKMRELERENPRILYRLVNSHNFEYVFGFFIFVNSVFLGMKADYRAAHPEDTSMATWASIDLGFLVVFCIELILRLLGQRLEFFTKPGMRAWNLFDMCVVAMPILEQVITWIQPDFAETQETRSASSSLRIMRLLKNVRIIRMVRLMRIFQELRLMLTSIFGAVKSLCWACLLLFLIMWVFGVFFVEGACDYLQDNPDMRDSVDEWYGSLGSALLTLFMSICGGLDWGDPAYAIKQAGVHFLLSYTVFIAFTQFCVLNIVTGIFLEHANTTAARDLDHVIQEDLALKDSLRSDIVELFREGDDDNSGDLTADEFENYLEDERVQCFFAMLELDIPAARDLFKVLDQDGNGHVDLDEFVDNCMRLRGHPKSVDLVNNLRLTEKLSEKMDQLLEAAMASPLPEKSQACIGSGESFGREVSPQTSAPPLPAETAEFLS